MKKSVPEFEMITEVACLLETEIDEGHFVHVFPSVTQAHIHWFDVTMKDFVIVHMLHRREKALCDVEPSRWRDLSATLG